MFCIGLFIVCMFCHGELARLKPAPRYLTRFYLMVSLGGALGAALVGIVAPLVLPAHFELALGLIAAAALLAWQVRADARVFGAARARRRCSSTVGCADLGSLDFYDTTIVTARNFYGVLRVQESGDRGEPASLARLRERSCTECSTCAAVPRARRPVTTRRPPASAALLETLHPRKEPLRVGVIGLGTGTLAAYGTPGRPLSLLRHQSGRRRHRQARLHVPRGQRRATIETPLGDARLTLEREPPQDLDLLAIDAFSSDAIPVHLITSEALALYAKHMKPGGVIAFHVTNRFLDLVPVVEALADAHGMQAVWIHDEADDVLASRSDWVLVSSNRALLAQPRIADAATPIERRPDWRLWTDDFNNLFQVLRRWAPDARRPGMPATRQRDRDDPT